MKNKVVRIKERNYEKLYKTKSLAKIVVACILLFIGVLIIGAILYFAFKTKEKGKIIENESKITTISFYQDGNRVNTVQGQYTKPTNDNGGEYLNVIDNGEIYFSINSKEEYSQNSFQVYSEDGREKKEEGIASIDKYGNASKKKLGKNEKSYLIELKNEYDTKVNNLIIVLTNENKKIYFTTKIVVNDETHIGQNIDFARDFQASIFDPNKLKEYESCLESNRNDSEESFAHVTIKSSFDYFCFKGLDVKKLTEPMCYIVKADEDTCMFDYKYKISLKIDGKRQNYFVNELIETRISTAKNNAMYLISYDRTLSRDINEKDKLLKNGTIDLGLGGEIPIENRVTSKKGAYLTFTIGDELLQYDREENCITRLFPVYKEDNSDYSVTASQFIKILNVDDDGNVNFTVTGNNQYGGNSGKTGLAVYYYENDSNRIYEDYFIESGRKQSYIKDELNLFISNFHARDIIYYYKDNQIIKVEEGEESVLGDDVDKDKIKSSTSGHHLAYEDKQEGTITWCNLYASRKEEVVDKDDENPLQIIGFSNESLIYGVSIPNSEVALDNGETVVPMKKINIIDDDGNIEKEYSVDGKIFLKALPNDESIELTLGAKKGDEYIETGKDYITVAASDTEKKNYFNGYTDEIYGNVNRILYPKDIEENPEYESVNLVTRKR